MLRCAIVFTFRVNEIYGPSLNLQFIEQLEGLEGGVWKGGVDKKRALSSSQLNLFNQIWLAPLSCQLQLEVKQRN